MSPLHNSPLCQSCRKICTWDHHSQYKYPPSEHASKTNLPILNVWGLQTFHKKIRTWQICTKSVKNVHKAGENKCKKFNHIIHITYRAQHCSQIQKSCVQLVATFKNSSYETLLIAVIIALLLLRNSDL